MDLLPIGEIAKKAGIEDRFVEPYGKHKAKIDLALFDELAKRPDGKLVLVTAITPTKAGEGKTTTTIGLHDGLRRIGVNSLAVLREPSLGPVFGVKGGAVGALKSTIVPSDDINLHFTGDFHALTSTINLIAVLSSPSITISVKSPSKTTPTTPKKVEPTKSSNTKLLDYE